MTSFSASWKTDKAPAAVGRLMPHSEYSSPTVKGPLATPRTRSLSHSVMRVSPWAPAVWMTTLMLNFHPYTLMTWILPPSMIGVWVIVTPSLPHTWEDDGARPEPAST